MTADRDPAYLTWVKRQRCCAPGAPTGCTGPVEAHHAGRRGVGQKAKDSTAIPLCAGHHRWGGWHEHRGPFTGWTAEQRRAWADERITWMQAKWRIWLGGLAAP